MEKEEGRIKGMVDSFSKRTGHGSIRFEVFPLPGGINVYSHAHVHYSSLEDGIAYLDPGDLVTFELEVGEDRNYAKKVSLVENERGAV